MRVFISYRREGGAEAAQELRDALVETFGADAVFHDRESLQPGEDFEEHIRDSIAACDVVLVVISANWVGTSADGSARRIDDEHDWVRVEVTAAAPWLAMLSA